jgi:hypothetical protein
MDTNHKGQSAVRKPFLGLLLAVCFLATAAHADPLFTGTFKVTNEVRWDNAVLAPGQYFLTLDYSGTSLSLIVRDAQSSQVIMRAFARTYYDANNATDSKLLVIGRGNRRAVCSVWLAGFGEVFQDAHPFRTSKRAAEEARNAEAIPVEMAQK